MTELKPSWMERWQIAGLVPWSWCIQTGICGPFFYGGLNKVTQKWGAGIFARAGRGLNNHWAVGLIGGQHNGAHLLEVVYVKCGYAVTVFGGVVEHSVVIDISAMVLFLPLIL